jgi:transcriptional accessory protein Tex/SPT6
MVEHIVTFIIAKFGGRKRDMDRAMDLAEKALEESGATARSAIESMRAVVEKLAEGQRPAARMLVSPVGESCATLRVGSLEHGAIDVDKATRDAIDAPDPVEVSSERTFRVLITELDLQTKACKVSLHDDEDAEKRHPGEITDPILNLPNNAYVSAMAAQRWIDVRGKAQSKEGELDKLYISNTIE